MSKSVVLLLAGIVITAGYAAVTFSLDEDEDEAHSHHHQSNGHSEVHEEMHSDGGHHQSGGHHAGGAQSYSVGEPAEAAKADRVVNVVMADTMTYRFNPDIDSIRDGEVINFVVTNEGKINHEFSIGNQADQIAHADMMSKMPNMIHDDPNTITVPPGESKSLAWRFKGDDLVVFACNIPGHYQAGMFKKSAIVSGEVASVEQEKTEHDHAH